MLEHGFITGSANIVNIDEEAKSFPIVEKNESSNLERVLSNSFGFGGTNATLIFEESIS
jgi:3-oxoacyl-[acyl-carrier-protein] synthase-1